MSKNEKLHLTIGGPNGDWEGDFNPNQHLHAVKVEGMAHLHLDPSQKDNYIITLNGQALDESKTLAELSIADEAMLVIEVKKAIQA